MNIRSFSSSENSPRPVKKLDLMQPASIDAEIAVLGGLLVDPYAYDRIADKLKPDYFYLTYHGDVFAAMQRIAADGQKIEMTNLAIALSEKLEGAQTLIHDLWEATVSAVTVDYYADVIVDKWMLRQIISSCMDTIRIAHEADAKPDICRNELEQRLVPLICRSQERWLSLPDSMIQTYTELEAIAAANLPLAIETGYNDLTSMLNGGLRGGELVVIAGRPSMGKSALANNLLINLATVSDRPSILFSLEMSRAEIVRRFWSGLVKEPWRLTQPKSIDWDDVSHAMTQLSTAPVWLDDSPGVDIDYVRSACRQFKIKQGDIGVIMLDYLQIMGGIDDRNPVQAIGKITKGLKNLARELNCPIVLLSQLSRGVESRTDKRPINSDLRDSGTIEQDADIILMLYRDDYYNKASPDQGIAEIIATKHRNGPTGTVKLIFDGYRSKFFPLSNGDEAHDF